MHLWGGDYQRRGQSGTLGLLLVLAIVLAGTTLIVVLGANSIGGTQETLDTERAEKAMTQLDSQTALVALGNARIQRVDLSTTAGGSYEVENDTGRMTLSYTNRTTGNRTVVFSEQMGSIVYETDSGDTIAYQGGGVWRTSGSNNSVMISPPEFHYREATLTLPLVTVNSTGTIGDRAEISSANTTRYFPNTTRSASYQNPVRNAYVELTVTSEYYRAWGRYFETRTDGQVEYDHAANTVRLALVSPVENTRVRSASASLSASGSFVLQGRAATPDCGGGNTAPTVYTDSYNSSGTNDDYCDQASAGTTGYNGDIIYGEDVNIDSGTGTANIRGDVVSGDTVNADGSRGRGQVDVFGNISYVTDCNNCYTRARNGGHGGGSVNRIGGVDTIPSINGIVQTRIDETRANPDNGAESDINGNTIDSGSVDISAGQYYLREIDLGSSDTVTLDTNGGDITLAVKENVDLASNARIEVVGDGNVSVYVEGTGGNTNQLEMGSDSAITNAGDNADQFRIFGQNNFTAAIGDGSGGANGYAKYVGVIYAPPGTSGPGSVSLDTGIVFGGILTGTTTVEQGGQGGSIHYDEALRETRLLAPGESTVRVTYIHASTNEVEVEQG